MKHIFLAVLLLVASCTTVTPTEPEDPVMVPGGYVQFCIDFPTSLLCE